MIRKHELAGRTVAMKLAALGSLAFCVSAALSVHLPLSAALHTPLLPPLLPRAALAPLRTPIPRLCADGGDQQEEDGEHHDSDAARAAEHALFETDEEALRSVGKAWALLFNPGGDSEGIYSRRLPAEDDEADRGVDLVVTFEEYDDASRYAAQLVATDFPEATPTEVDTSQLLEFCQGSGHLLGLVRSGTLVVPPERSVVGLPSP